MPTRPRDGTKQPTLFPATVFEGFGPSRFRPAEEAVVGRRFHGRRGSRIKQQVRAHAPRCPGVYGMFNSRGRLIYIGKAKNLRARLLSYFRENSRDPKATRIIRQARVLCWEQTGDEFAALLRELELIQTLEPRLNVLGVPGFRRHHYICLGKSPVPQVYVTNSPTGKELGVYGPLALRPKSEDAARRLNDWFKLRDCPHTVPLGFSDQGELFAEERSAKCLRFELETCAGPCAAACSRSDYARGVRGAKAFLDGRDRGLLAQLRRRMEDAAAQLEFEKAAALRDRLLSLEWLDARLSLLRHARTRSSFVYPLVGSDGRERWYLIGRGQVRAVCFAPATDGEKTRAARLLTAAFAGAAEAAVLSACAVDSVLLVAAWFRRHADESAKLLKPRHAHERCRVDASAA